MGGEEYGDGGNSRLEAASTVREPRPPERVAIGELFGGAGVRLIMVGVQLVKYHVPGSYCLQY